MLGSVLLLLFVIVFDFDFLVLPPNKGKKRKGDCGGGKWCEWKKER